MSTLENSEFNFSIHFDNALYFSTEVVLRKISQATYYFQLCNMPEKKQLATYLGILKNNSNSGGDGTLLQNLDPITDPWERHKNILKEIYEEEELRDQNYYYIDRIIKSVLSSKLELWNWDMTKALDVPIINPSPNNIEYKKFEETISKDVLQTKFKLDKQSILDGSFEKKFREKFPSELYYSPLHHNVRYQRQYDNLDNWLSWSNIYKSDLIEFCKTQRIHAFFENENSYSHTSEIKTETIEVENIKKSRAPNRVGKLALEIASEIKNRTGKKATVDQVMETLQRWAKEGTKSDILVGIDGNGVKWLTEGYEPANFTRQACAKLFGRRMDKKLGKSPTSDNDSSLAAVKREPFRREFTPQVSLPSEQEMEVQSSPEKWFALMNVKNSNE